MSRCPSSKEYSLRDVHDSSYFIQLISNYGAVDFIPIKAKDSSVYIILIIDAPSFYYIIKGVRIIDVRVIERQFIFRPGRSIRYAILLFREPV